MAPPSKAAAFWQDIFGNLGSAQSVTNVTETLKQYQLIRVVTPKSHQKNVRPQTWRHVGLPFEKERRFGPDSSFLSSRFHCLNHSGTQLSRRVGHPNLKLGCVCFFQHIQPWFRWKFLGLPNASLFQCCDLILRIFVRSCWWFQKCSNLNVNKKSSLLGKDLQ